MRQRNISLLSRQLTPKPEKRQEMLTAKKKWMNIKQLPPQGIVQVNASHACETYIKCVGVQAFTIREEACEV
jgi:hypothetical protein